MNSLINSNINRNTIELLLQSAQNYIDQPLIKENNGTVVNLFYENSTRTDLSFQMAAQKLGLHTLKFNISHSSISKKESLIDTLQTIEALGVDIAVIRHTIDWPSELQNYNFNFSLINAGSGISEHPTQALLDALTIRQECRTLHNLNITIAGDIKHSRVARSNYNIFTKMGANVTFTGPDEFKPNDLIHVPWINIDDIIKETDVLIMLRIQHERHNDNFNINNYHTKYGLTKQRLANLKSNALIMHPGPINRGVEICTEAICDRRCKILNQVNNGVALRMAVLNWCLQRNSNLISM